MVSSYEPRERYTTPVFTREDRSVSTARHEVRRSAGVGAGTSVPLFQRVETYFILLALFVFTTGGAFLTPATLRNAEVSGTLTAGAEPSGPLHMIQLVIAFAITVTLTLSHWRSVLSASLRVKFMTAATGLAIFSVLWSQDPAVTVRTGLYLCLNTLFVYYLVRRFSPDDLMRLFIGLGVLTAALSLSMAIVVPSYAWTRSEGLPALQGAFSAKNALGQMCVLFLTPALFLRGMRRVSRATYILLMLVTIALSFSVQAWVATFLCFCYVGVQTLSRRLEDRDFKWLTFVTVLPVGVGLVVLLTFWLQILDFFGKDPTLSSRTTIWGAVIGSILKHPLLGWGYGAFWNGMKGEAGSLLVIIHFPISQAQNGPLEVLLNTGAVGLAFVVGTFFQAFRNAKQCFRVGGVEVADWYLLLVLFTIFYTAGEADLMLPNSAAWMMYVLACTGLALETHTASTRSITVETVDRRPQHQRRHPQTAPAEHCRSLNPCA